MKINKNFLFFHFCVCFLALKSQNGLENIIVEKYYVSDANDTTGRLVSGHLPIGSVTYRIYLDMLPGYRFYAAYGKTNHELRLETTTLFFNNEDIGNRIPNVIPRRTLGRNTVMLDSWLSAGAAAENYFGVLKEQDDSTETIFHEKLFLQNKNKLAGIPVKDRDGLVAADKVPFPVFFGVDTLVDVFFNQTKGPVFATSNGAWGCLGGAIGPDSLTTNRLLIAQLTTNGDLSFELNVQIGKQNAPPEYYVAKNPAGNEITLPSLTYRRKKTKSAPAKSNLTASRNNNLSKIKQNK